MNTLDALSGRAKPQVIAFEKLISNKKPPHGKEKKDLFRFLKKTAKKAVADADEGHLHMASISLVFMQGLAIGLQVVTEDELADINSIRM